MKFKLKNRERVVGLFVFIAIIFLIASLFLTGVNKRWFRHDYIYVSRFKSASGLSQGMGINLRGFKIGQIKKITLNQKNNVDITIAIYEEYLDKVVENSMIELVSNPLGLGGGLNFYPGKEKTAPLIEYSFIPSNQSIEGDILLAKDLVDKPKGNDTVTRLLAGLEPILLNSNDLLISSTALLNNLNSGLEGNQSQPLGQILVDAEGKLDLVDPILKNIDEISQNAIAISSSIALLSKNIEDPRGLVPKVLEPEGSVATFLNDNNQLFNYIDGILSSLNSSLENLNKLSQDLVALSPELALTLNQTSQAISQGEKVLEGVSNNPLIKNGISPKPKTDHGVRSLREGNF